MVFSELLATVNLLVGRQLEEHGECRAPACDYCGPIVGLNRGAEDAGWVGREGYGRHGGDKW